MLKILIFALLAGLLPVPVSDFMIGIGFAPVSFVLFWIGLGLASYFSPLYLIYLAEALLYGALFWVLAGRVAGMPPLPRRIAAVAVVAGSILLWLAPIHCRIDQGIGEQKPLAALFADEYDRFKELRALRMPPEPMIHQPSQGAAQTRAVAPQIQSTPTIQQGVVQQPADEVPVPHTDK